MELDGLQTEFLGRNLMYFDVIDSTQKKVKLIKQPQNGTIVIADRQIEAVGTHDRKWYTGSGKNIAMSFVLLPNCNIQKIDNITIKIAECLVKVLKKITELNLQIKEPNDIYYNGKKLGGILTEIFCKGENVSKLYIGIGINVNQEMFPGNLNEIATSLKKEIGKEFDRKIIIEEFLKEFEKVYLKAVK